MARSLCRVLCHPHAGFSVHVKTKYFIFFHGNVCDLVMATHSVTYCIYIAVKPGFCFHCYCAVYAEYKESDTSWTGVASNCLFITPSRYHHCANLSEDIELI